jgi:hypothetical protein
MKGGSGHIILTIANHLLAMGHKKWSLSNPGFKPETFRFLAHHANQLHYLGHTHKHTAKCKQNNINLQHKNHGKCKTAEQNRCFVCAQKNNNPTTTNKQTKNTHTHAKNMKLERPTDVTHTV